MRQDLGGKPLDQLLEGPLELARLLLVAIGLAAALLILNLVGTSAAGQAPAPGQRVLVLYSDERLLPANIIVDEAIRATFAVGTNNRIEFYSEFLDVARFPGEDEQQRQRDFFRDKYRERPPDLVIAVSGGALVFLAKHRPDLFAGVPIVYCPVAGDPHLDHLSDARIAEVPVPDSIAPTLEMMLHLHPGTRQVVVVSGSGPRDRQMADTCTWRPMISSSPWATQAAATACAIL